MENLIFKAVNVFLHIDGYLGALVENYGVFIYPLLFLVIFCETGLVITPFLPGDSLIFAAGTFAGTGALNIAVLFALFAGAAIIGDSVNYFIGSYFGENVFAKSRFFKKEYLQKTKDFYKKYGGKTIVIARFIPIIRTFAPFVAGVGKMDYRKFIMFNVAGGLLWVIIFLFAGYFFGSIPLVKNNLSIVIIAIMILSVTPVVWEYLKHKRS
jgi:membrane-associated protein